MELIEVGHGAGIRVNAVDQHRVTIGRNPDSDVVISDATVSRSHAVLECIGGVWKIRDLGSRNGTYVNGARVDKVARVQPGDRVEIGTATFRLAEPDPGSRPDLATIRPVAAERAEVHLTPREKEVLRQVAEGRTDEAIAASMVVSIKTVRSHLDRVRDKTGSRRRPDLTRWAIQQGLTEER